MANDGVQQFPRCLPLVPDARSTAAYAAVPTATAPKRSRAEWRFRDDEDDDRQEEGGPRRREHARDGERREAHEVTVDRQS